MTCISSPLSKTSKGFIVDALLMAWSRVAGENIQGTV